MNWRERVVQGPLKRQLWIGRTLLRLPHPHSSITIPDRGVVWVCHRFHLILSAALCDTDGRLQPLSADQLNALMELRAELTHTTHVRGRIPASAVDSGHHPKWPT